MIKLYGIRFNVPNEYGCILEKILHDINVEEYDWFIEYEDILVEPVNEGKDLFKSNVIKGGDFRKEVSGSIYYVIFLRLFAFPVGKKITPINSFADYFSSDCELMLFVTDSIFVELYSKKEELIFKVNSSAQYNNFSKMEIINELGKKDQDLLHL